MTDRFVTLLENPMNRLFFLALLALPPGVQAAQKAIAGAGDEVMLHDNDAGIYVNPAKKVATALATNPMPFTKGAGASFEVKSKINKASVWIDPKLWKFSKSENNEVVEYVFWLKDADLYGFMINEAIEIPIESLTRVILENARKVAPDARFVEQEYRSLNGSKVIYARIDATEHGTNLSFLSYYFANASGFTQLLLGTRSNFVDKHKAVIENFLNGLVVE